MSESNGNGVITLGEGMPGDRGRIRVRYDANSAPVDIDLLVAANRWYTLDRSFRNEKDEIPDDQVAAFQTATASFLIEMLQIPPERQAQVTWAEANHFVAVLTREARKLKDFFASVSGNAPSSRASMEVVFAPSEAEID